MGARGACGHWGHCSRDGVNTGYHDPDEATNFRSMVLHHYRIQEPSFSTANEWKAHRNEVPRVTLVQRAKTRRIRNLEEVIDAIEDAMGVKPLVVEMTKLTVEEQVRKEESER